MRHHSLQAKYFHFLQYNINAGIYAVKLNFSFGSRQIVSKNWMQHNQLRPKVSSTYNYCIQATMVADTILQVLDTSSLPESKVFSMPSIIV